MSQDTMKSYPTVFLIPKAQGFPSLGFFVRSKKKIHHRGAENAEGKKEPQIPTESGQMNTDGFGYVLNERSQAKPDLRLCEGPGLCEEGTTDGHG